jgi:ABC-type antimicrobial peptide transport system permease subunit
MKQYILIFLQVFIGIAFLCVCLTVFAAVYKTFNELKSIPVNNLLILEYSYLGYEAPEKEEYFTMEDYKWLKDNYSDEAYIYFEYRKGNIVYGKYNDNDKDKYFHLVYVSDDYFKVNLQNDKAGFDDKLQIIAGDAAIEFFSDRNNALSESSYKFYDELIYDDNLLPKVRIGDKIFTIKPLSELKENKDDKIQIKYVSVLYSDYKDDLDNYLFIPLEYADIKINNYHSEVTFGMASKQGNARDLKAAYDLYIRLFERNNGQYYYIYNTLTDSLELSLMDVKNKLYQLIIMSVTALAAVSVGIAGLLMIIIKRRKRELAICFALGATKKHLITELFLESAILTLFGGTGGVCLAYLIIELKIFTFPAFIIEQNYFIMFICILISFLISVIGTILPVMKIKKLMPMQILKGN